MESIVWVDLLLVGTLIWIGYLGARLTSFVRLPAVTGFLIVGIVLGPYGFGLLTGDLLGKVAFVKPLALGVIVFLIAEQLTRRMLSRHDWSFWLASGLNIVLPGVLVGLALWLIAPDDPVPVVLLAIIAVSGAPATIMAVISELQARSRACDMMLGASALDSIFTVVLYAAAAPFLMLFLNIHSTAGEALAHTARQIGGAAALGVAAGLVLAWLVRRVFRDGELLTLGLMTVFLAVASAEILDFSSILAPLVAGITLATVEEGRGERARVFRSVRTVEYPVYIIFFTLAGASLELAVVLAAGGLAVGYIVARSAGKFAAGMIGSLAAGYDRTQSAWVGLGMLPQAGVAVGLGLSAAEAFPEAGPTVSAVVLASIVFFEVVGPVFTRHAVSCTLEPADSDAAADTAPALSARTILLPVSPMLPPERLLGTLESLSLDPEASPDLVLAHVVVSGRPRQTDDSLARAEEHLQALAEAVRLEGYEVDTKVTSDRSLDSGIARLAEESHADLVAIGSPSVARGRLARLSPVKTLKHRIIDGLEVPVLVVPTPKSIENPGPAQAAASPAAGDRR